MKNGRYEEGVVILVVVVTRDQDRVDRAFGLRINHMTVRHRVIMRITGSLKDVNNMRSQ